MAQHVATQPTEPAQTGIVLLACACLAPDDPALIWAPFRGRPLLAWSLMTYAQTLPDAPIILVVDDDHLPMAHDLCTKLGLSPAMPLPISEYARRRDVTSSGLAALQAHHPSCEWVIIHEATRPLVTSRLIVSVLEHARQADCSAIASEPVKETLKRMTPGGDGQPDRVAETLPRERLACAQTPQVFRLADLAHALAVLLADVDPPDEATIAALAGLPMLAVPGDHSNLRVSSQADLPILAAQDGATSGKVGSQTEPMSRKASSGYHAEG